MFHVEQTYDKELMKHIISDDEIIDGFTDKKHLDNYIDFIGDDHICYLGICNNVIAGIMILFNCKSITDEKNLFVIDIGFLKDYRGKVALSICKLSMNKLFDDVGSYDLVGSIDKSNRKSLVHAKKLGFKISNFDDNKYFMRYSRYG